MTSVRAVDADGVKRSFEVEDDGGVYTPVGVVRHGGTTGTDYSVNAAAIPIDGLVLLTTIPATLSRSSFTVQNQSADQIQVVRDNGSGGQASSILLASGGAAGVQGGSDSSTTFKGRIRVYGVTGSQVAACQD